MIATRGSGTWKTAATVKRGSASVKAKALHLSGRRATKVSVLLGDDRLADDRLGSRRLRLR